MANKIHIEVNSGSGASKWVKDIVSHDSHQIFKAWEDNETIRVKDAFGGYTCIDMSDAFVLRVQDDGAYERRRRDARR